MKFFSSEEIKTNVQLGKSWLVINNFVYDVDDFFETHPGGPQIIKDELGKDATEVFNNIGHSDEAYQILDTLKIGKLKEKEKILPIKKSNEIKTNSCNFSIFAPLIILLLSLIIYQLY